MKSRFTLVLTLILMLFLANAVMSGFLTLIFRDVRTGPLGAYMTGYLWPRFMEFATIFAPVNLVVSGLLLAGWLLYEASRPPKT